VSTDSTFTWKYCEEYDGQIECEEGPEFKYEISGETLILSQYQDMWRNMKFMVCPVMKLMQEAFGVEMGHWKSFGWK
jgi:hypothetical protein